MNRITEFLKVNRFNVLSWGATMILVAALLGSALWWTRAGSPSVATRPIPTASNQNPSSVTLPKPANNAGFDPTIARQLELKTNIPADRPRLDPVTYRVTRGDSMFAIAKQFNVKPESILYSNKDVLNDNPESLTPGMELTIPPTDGLLYDWKQGDTIEKVADEFKAKADDILNWPGNNLDLTNPQIKPGTVVMIPGGQRELVDWTQFIPTISRGVSGAGTGTSNIGTHACNGGPVGSGFIWPTNGPHTLSGNDYGPGHLGIDITAPEGTPVLAAASGVVVLAQGGWNYGYGNFVEIDHGNGYATVYAHLGQINVQPCDPVLAGQVIGLADSTGNSTGSHLHFEIRKGGSNLNPWELLQ